MFRLNRLMSLLVLLALALILAAPALAQGDLSGLNARDVTVWRTAIQATQAATSFQFTLDATLDIEAGEQQVRVSLEGFGSVLTGEQPSFDITLDGSTENVPDFPGELTLEARLVDGTLYLRGQDSSQSEPSDWESVAIADIGQLLEGAVSGGELSSLQGFGPVFEAIARVQYGNFIRLERPGREPRFVATFDFRDFFLAPGFANVLGELLRVSDPATTYTPAQVSAVSAVVGTIFQQPSLAAQVFIGPDRRVSRVQVDMNLQGDPSGLVPDSTAFAVTLDANLELTDFDAPVVISAPDAAPIVRGEPTLTPNVALEPLAGKALFPGQPVRVFLTSASPVNFVYYAYGPETISIYTASLPENPVAVDSTLRVLTADGELLAENDDLVDVNAGIENLRLPGPGAYRIQLDTFANGERGGIEVRLEAAP